MTQPTSTDYMAAITHLDNARAHIAICMNVQGAPYEAFELFWADAILEQLVRSVRAEHTAHCMARHPAPGSVLED